MKIRLALLSKDYHFARRLQIAFQYHYGDRYELLLFDDKEELENFLQKESFQVLLLDGEESLPHPKNKLLQLALVEDSLLHSVSSISAMYKYQSVRSMNSIILEELSSYSTQTLSMDLDRSYTSIWISSLTNNQEAVDYGKKLATHYAKKAKTLYMNLDYYHYSAYEENKGRSFSDLLFSLKSAHSNLSLKLTSVLKKSSNDYYYLPRIRLFSHIFEITEKDTEKLLTLLESQFTYLIFAAPLPKSLLDLVFLKRSTRRIFLFQKRTKEKLNYVGQSMKDQLSWISFENSRFLSLEEGKEMMFHIDLTEDKRGMSRWIR